MPRIPEGYSEDLTARLHKGLNCGSSYIPGWAPIIEDLNTKLAELHPDYVVNQIKSKFNIDVL